MLVYKYSFYGFISSGKNLGNTIYVIEKKYVSSSFRSINLHVYCLPCFLYYRERITGGHNLKPFPMPRTPNYITTFTIPAVSAVSTSLVPGSYLQECWTEIQRWYPRLLPQSAVCLGHFKSIFAENKKKKIEATTYIIDEIFPESPVVISDIMSRN